MIMEQELKLTVLSEQGLDLGHLSWLQALLDGEVTACHLSNTYFDTADNALMRFGVGLRLRQIDDRWLQTVKTRGHVSAGLHQRQEWEQEVNGPAFDLAALRQTALAPLVDDANVWPALQAIFKTDFERQIYPLKIQQSEIELAYDYGVVQVAEQQQLIHEIELELKHGEIADCRDLAKKLVAELPLHYSDISKAERGYKLVQSIENNE